MLRIISSGRESLSGPRGLAEPREAAEAAGAGAYVFRRVRDTSSGLSFRCETIHSVTWHFFFRIPPICSESIFAHRDGASVHRSCGIGTYWDRVEPWKGPTSLATL